MDPLVRHFVALAQANAWANHRLLRACAQLDPAEFVAPRTGFFPSIKATLNHIVTVDWFYVDGIERGLAGQPLAADARACFDPPEPFERCDELAAAQRAVDRRLLAICRGLGTEDLARRVTIAWSPPGSERIDRVLPHLFLHQVHHRGQAHAMLSGTRVPPPQLDEFFCANDAPLRAQDLAELGTSEDEIWGASAPR